MRCSVFWCTRQLQFYLFVLFIRCTKALKFKFLLIFLNAKAMNIMTRWAWAIVYCLSMEPHLVKLLTRLLHTIIRCNLQFFNVSTVIKRNLMYFFFSYFIRKRWEGTPLWTPKVAWMLAMLWKFLRPFTSLQPRWELRALFFKTLLQRRAKPSAQARQHTAEPRDQLTAQAKARQLNNEYSVPVVAHLRH